MSEVLSWHLALLNTEKKGTHCVHVCEQITHDSNTDHRMKNDSCNATSRTQRSGFVETHRMTYTHEMRCVVFQQTIQTQFTNYFTRGVLTQQILLWNI